MSAGQSVQTADSADSSGAFSSAVQFFHDQLDHDISTVATAPVETPREYFTEVRGWSEETVENLKLGYAPKSAPLKAHLRDLGYDDEELLATGLFTELDSGDISCLFKGRYVFPYYDEAGEPAYAIAREAGEHSTLGGKYVKCATSGSSEVQEPIFGIHEFDPDKGCWIVEGMADATTALEHEMPVLSPVTTQFKQDDRERLLEILEVHDIENVMVVADNDEAGLQGAVSTATFISESGYDASVTTPPNEGEDLDGYVESRDDFEKLVSRQTPVEEHECYNEVSTESTQNSGTESRDYDGPLSNLTIPDVEPRLSAGYRGKNPLSHSGSRTNYFVVKEDGRVAFDHKKKVGYNPITYLLCDIGTRSPDSPNGELSNNEIQAVREAASNRGLISEDEDDTYQLRSDGSEQSIALPEIPSPSEGEWQDTLSDDETALTLDEARTRCQRQIDTALHNGAHKLIDALPAMGKSSGVIRGAAKTDTPISVFTARHDLYGQYSEWCEEHGLSYHQLPSFHEDCPTARGEHGDDWRKKVLDIYDEGVMASEIHKWAEEYFGEPLPCDDGQECSYKQEWDFESDEYDVLIGHYQHAYNPDITAGRVAVFDEFPADSFLLEFEGNTVTSAVSAYVSRQGGLPFEDFTELIEGRNSEQGEAARDWFDADDLERDGEPVLNDASGSANAYAPLLTYAVLVGENLGNGWEHADLDAETGVGNHRRAARNRDSGEVFLLLPPELNDANGVIALDGTPTPDLWQLAVDTRLSHEQVLSDKERADYLTDALDCSIIQTTDATKTYSSGTYVKPEEDGLLFEAVAKREETEPALISTRRAIGQYEQEGVLAPIGKHEYYGNLKGSNQFKSARVGIVAGSQHYGDDYVERWGALAGTSVERGDGKGMDLDYGKFGNKVLRQMREHEVLQAVLRFGRNGDDANIYVHTAVLPEWVPVEAEGRIERWSKGVQEVVEVLENDAPDEWRTSDVAEQVSISKRQVRANLKKLADAGYVEKRKEGRGITWVVSEETIDRLGQVEFRSS
ncbi:toprim domain-containing protein [Natronomonas salsuginis]|uniref:HTH arsR-type domain-containing protein n=1 Tax=Natronomonas salsuginis TaxID=2217661 RepID=A0A4U5JC76_9EURY|nr:toprim domain-containing protein [Natronomonas salsuginis]TKR25891.1 hypothetical protein DM868_05170 [Natronomonas salsuginis]